MNQPKISIGLPVFNGANFVAEAIQSVLAQTFTDFELVISDNASTDSTESICRDFAQRDQRIQYVRAAQNQGAAGNFNRTFELSSGKYFKWLAHDDTIAPTYLERAILALEQNPSVVLCHSKTAIIDLRGNLVTGQSEKDLAAWDLQGISPEMEQKRITAMRCSHAYQRFLGVLLYSIRNHEVFGLIRREAMLRTGLHHPYVGGEKVFLAELSLTGSFHEVEEYLSFSRWHSQRFSSNVSARAQSQHMDPNGASRLKLPRQVRSTRGYFAAVTHGQLGVLQRAGCLLALAKFLLQMKKWRKVIGDYFGGVGQLSRLPESRSNTHTSEPQRHWTSQSFTSVQSAE